MEDNRDTEPQDPIPSNQDPFFSIVAPNLDGISRSSFDRGTVSRRRIVRAGILMASILAVIAAIAVIGAIVASFG